MRLSYAPTTSSYRHPQRLLVYLPALPIGTSTARLPVHVNIHGSGFCLNSFGADADFCAWLADSVLCVVVDIEHRKAPEHPWPAAPNDVRDATGVVRELAESHGWDANRISIGGFSSGGNLALVEASRVRERDEGMLCAVIAFYPSTNLAEPASKKPQLQIAKGGAGSPMPIWFRRFLYSCYLPHTVVHNTQEMNIPPGDDKPTRADPRISPLSAKAGNFPPATIITASQDSLQREAVQLVDKLKGEGKDVVHWEAPGQGHGWNLSAKDNTEPGKLRLQAYELTRDRLRDAHEKALVPPSTSS
ncbi:Alpha/Beta hydrolase protein [Vararia minispora EC-137]|uniref:Alpha/Beta hydrolase protein n=1 Tax=Vararia minispora EC-137 TaxID=1314806 RepID=A0ACB8QJD7_9AGAM|nr:Alpha/Beta hydrolase protein [Vararia minispora EC-137]